MTAYESTTKSVELQALKLMQDDVEPIEVHIGKNLLTQVVSELKDRYRDIKEVTGWMTSSGKLNVKIVDDMEGVRVVSQADIEIEKMLADE